MRNGIPKKGVGEHWNRNPAKHAASMLIQKLKKAGEIVQKREGVWARATNDEQYDPAPSPEVA